MAKRTLIVVVALTLGIVMLGCGSKESDSAGKAEIPQTKDPVLGEGPASPVSMTGHGGKACLSVVFTPDGKRAVSQCNGLVHVWDLEKRVLGTRPWPLQGDRKLPGRVAVSPDGAHIAATAQRSLAFFDGTDFKRK